MLEPFRFFLKKFQWLFFDWLLREGAGSTSMFCEVLLALVMLFLLPGPPPGVGDPGALFYWSNTGAASLTRWQEFRSSANLRHLLLVFGVWNV